MGDLNIDTSDKTKDTSCYLSDLCDTFSLKNIISGKICFKKTTGTSIDILLTNRPRSFLKTGIFEAGLSDHVSSFFNFFDHTFHRFHQKLYNTGNIKHLRDLHFYMSWIKNF